MDSPSSIILPEDQLGDPADNEQVKVHGRQCAEDGRQFDDRAQGERQAREQSHDEIGERGFDVPAGESRHGSVTGGEWRVTSETAIPSPEFMIDLVRFV